MRIKYNIFRFILPAALALLGTAACVSVDVETAPEKELTFKVFQTKATTTPVIGSMGIFASKTPDAAGSTAASSWKNSDFWNKKDNSGLYINDALFAPYNGSYAGADPNDINKHVSYFWPRTGSLMFAAYSPHQSQHASIKSATLRNQSQPEYMSLLQIDVVLDPEKVKVETSPLDLLWADPSSVNNGKTAGKQSEALPLLFSHAQAKVTFRISNPEEQYKMSAKLVDCVNSAVFFSGENPGWLPNFTDQENLLRDYDLFDMQPLTATPRETSLIVIPMKLDGQYPQVGPNTDKVVTLQLELVSNDEVGRETVNIPMTDYSEKWEYGKHYTYNITIHNRKVQFAEPVITSRDDTTNL